MYIFINIYIYIYIYIHIYIYMYIRIYISIAHLRCSSLGRTHRIRGDVDGRAQRPGDGLAELSAVVVATAERLHLSSRRRSEHLSRRARICIQIHTHTHTHTHTHLSIQLHLHLHLYMYIYLVDRARSDTYTYIHDVYVMYVCIYASIYLSILYRYTIFCFYPVLQRSARSSSPRQSSAT